ncbi:MAG TPA: hypothetical protein VF401_04745 [Candidatus Saccharimonadales bacterium]
MRIGKELAAITSVGIACATSACGLYDTPPDESMRVFCDNDPAAAIIVNFAQLGLRRNHPLTLEVADQHEKMKIKIRMAGRISIHGQEVTSRDAGKVIATLPTARVLAGTAAPSPDSGYYAGDKGLTLACNQATIDDMRHNSLIVAK